MSHDKRRQFGNEHAGVLGKDKAVEEWDKFLKDGPDMPNITTAEPLTATTRLAASPENPVTDLTWPPPALTIALAKAGGPGLPPALALQQQQQQQEAAAAIAAIPTPSNVAVHIPHTDPAVEQRTTNSAKFAAALASVKATAGKPVKVGDVVVVAARTEPPHLWFGKVTKTYGSPANRLFGDTLVAAPDAVPPAADVRWWHLEGNEATDWYDKDELPTWAANYDTGSGDVCPIYDSNSALTCKFRVPDVGSKNSHLIKEENVGETRLVCKIRITGQGKVYVADQLKMTALLHHCLLDWF